MQEQQYVEEREGNYYLRGSRVPVTALAALWHEGSSPEAMLESYPSLSLALVYGGLAFYLEFRFEIDCLLQEDRLAYDAAYAAVRATNSEHYAELERRFAVTRARNAASTS